MAEQVTITFQVNGVTHTTQVWPMERLLDVLRRNLGLTGVKEGCGEGECGACAISFNGELATSCLIPALEAGGASITTIEGLATAEALHPLQQSFLEHGAAQCGFCTPGMILASIFIQPGTDEAAIRAALAGNLCRCTGYAAIVAAVRASTATQDLP